jgi:hypothetical protein
MKSQGMLTSIRKVLFFISYAAVLVACDTQQGTMHGGGSSMNMGNWNWIQILIGIIIGFILGYLFIRRRK